MDRHPVGVYGAGHPNIDRDHDILLTILDELRRPDMNSGYLDVALTHLSAYLDAHFEHEELLIDRHQFAGGPAHREEHRRIRDHAANLTQRARSGQISIGEVADTVERKIHEHILVTDQQLAAFLRTVNVSPVGPPTGEFQPTD